MEFYLDPDTVTLDDPAQYPSSQDTMLVQARERSASGISQVEDFVVQVGTWTYAFKDMSDADYVLLMDWFINKAEGMLNQFQLTDDLGNVNIVRFTTPRLNFITNFLDLWDGKFTVEIIT